MSYSVVIHPSWIRPSTSFGNPIHTPCLPRFYNRTSRDLCLLGGIHLISVLVISGWLPLCWLHHRPAFSNDPRVSEQKRPPSPSEPCELLPLPQENSSKKDFSSRTSRLAIMPIISRELHFKLCHALHALCRSLCANTCVNPEG